MTTDALLILIRKLERRLASMVSVVSGSAGISQLTGHVTAGPGSGSQVATIPNDTVTNALAANMAEGTIKLRAAGSGTGDPIDGTADQASAILDGASDPFLRTSDATTGAPADADYLVKTGNGSLSAERVVTDTATVTWDWATGGQAKANVVSPTPGGSGGGLVLLEQHTAVSDPTLDFTTWYSSAYDKYWIDIIGIIPESDNASFYLQVSTDGGGTWASSNYAYSILAVNSLAATATSGVESGGSGILLGVSRTAANGGFFDGSVQMFDPGTTTRKHRFIYDTTFFPNDNHYYRWMAMGAWIDTSNNIDALRFVFDSGDIAEGTIRIYGLAKS